jgi:hypothetical protein
MHKQDNAIAVDAILACHPPGHKVLCTTQQKSGIGNHMTIKKKRLINCASQTENSGDVTP